VSLKFLKAVQDEFHLAPRDLDVNYLAFAVKV